MPRSLLRPRRLVAPSEEPALEPVPPPSPASEPSGDETTARQGATVEVEDVEGQGAGSDLHAGQPTPVEGEEPLEEPGWRERFSSPDEMWERLKNVDHIRGRHANEVGIARRQLRLQLRLIRLLARTENPFERQTLATAAGLIPERLTLEKIEEMIEVGEEFYEEEEAASAL